MNSKLVKNILSQRGTINSHGTINSQFGTRGTLNSQIGTRGTLDTRVTEPKLIYQILNYLLYFNLIIYNYYL